MEDGAAQNGSPLAESRAAQATVKSTSKDQIAARGTKDEASKSAPGRGLRESSPPRRALPSNPRPQAQRRVEDRRAETDSRQSSSTYRPDYTIERKARPAEERSPRHTQDARDQLEDHRRSEVKAEKRKETGRLVREAKHPTLIELLPHDEDLKEWLEITGYHNAPYREKILNRRRAIAALDAQKNALLAEEEAEERGGGLPTPSSSSIMLPPPIPNKVGDRAEGSTSKPPNTILATLRARVVSNKRPHSETQDSQDESSAKMARTNDRGPRFKQEDGADYRGPRSNGYDSSQRRSSDDRRDDRDPPRYEGRGRGRADSRDRNVSPGRMIYENRPAARNRSYENGDDYYSQDRGDWEDDERGRNSGDKRPFTVRGAYKGRAFDPNYRGRGSRGGGRGRGDFQGHSELRAEPGSFGARIANAKPYKDEQGFDMGGKGGS